MVTNASQIQYKDDKGKVAGISKDIMERIKQETGLELEYLMAKSYDEAKRYMRLSELANEYI